MFLWFGIDVDQQLADLKRLCEKAEKQAGFRVQGYSLPMHISLKIPFQVPDEEAAPILEACAAYLASLRPFPITVKALENRHSIVWLRILESPALCAAQDGLLALLQSRFQIAPHAYDTDRAYHVTLFMDEDPAKNDLACSLLGNAAFPDTLFVRRIGIGESPTGELGTYHPVRFLMLDPPEGEPS